MRVAMVAVVSLALTLSAAPAAAATATYTLHKPVPTTPSTLPPLPPAVFDNTLNIGGNDLGGRDAGTRMTVEVRVNGHGPYHFVVDSGADSSVVGLRLARAFQMPTGTPAVLNATTGSSLVDRVMVAELGLGQSTFHDLEVPALPEGDLGAEGLIGIDALVEQRLMMDFETRTIKVEDARIPAQIVDGEIVVTARRRRGQLILTQVSAAGYPLDAVIDTGSEITIGNLALRNKLIRGNRDKFVTVAATGVTGVTVNLQLARVGELKLGPVTLHNVPIAFADVPPFAVFGLSKQPSLLLGTDLLATFRRVSLDFRARKVRFQLKRCGTTGVFINTSPESFARLSSNDNGEVCRR